MLDTCRIYWRNFSQYFNVIYFLNLIIKIIASGACHSEEIARFFVQSKAILRIYDFTLNGNPNLFGEKVKMGDVYAEPQFVFPIHALYCIIKGKDYLKVNELATKTRGIEDLKHWAPNSFINRHPPSFPDNELQYLIQHRLLTGDHIIARSMDVQMKYIITFLCWGSPDYSSYFINEIMNFIVNNKTYYSSIETAYAILQDIISLNDKYKQHRIQVNFLLFLN
jgi:hypothetical protein